MFIQGNLGINPIEKLMDKLGEMALRLIILTLLVSSLSDIKYFRSLIIFRRMIGLFVFSPTRHELGYKTFYSKFFSSFNNQNTP